MLYCTKQLFQFHNAQSYRAYKTVHCETGIVFCTVILAFMGPILLILWKYMSLKNKVHYENELKQKNVVINVYYV